LKEKEKPTRSRRGEKELVGGPCPPISGFVGHNIKGGEITVSEKRKKEKDSQSSF